MKNSFTKTIIGRLEIHKRLASASSVNVAYTFVVSSGGICLSKGGISACGRLRLDAASVGLDGGSKLTLIVDRYRQHRPCVCQSASLVRPIHTETEKQTDIP